MNLAFATAAVLALALAGLAVLRLLWPAVTQVPRTVRLALGYLVGSLWITLLFFGLYLARLPFTRFWLLAPTVILALAGLWIWCRGPWSWPRPDPYLPLAIGLVIVTVALAWGRPVYTYDAISMWALKAKMTFTAGTWPPTMFDPYTTHHPEYPPLIPCAQAFVFFALGKFDDVASRIVFAAFSAAGAAVLWWWLGVLRVSARGLWVALWCALPLVVNQVRICYADLPLAVALLACTGAIAAWLHQRDRSDWLRLAGLFGGLAFWIKQDALITVGAGFVALFALAAARRIPWRPVTGAALLTLVIAVPWPVYAWCRGLPSDFGWPHGLTPARLGLITRTLINSAFLDDGYAFFWPLAVVALGFRWHKLRTPAAAWLLVTAVLALAGTVAVYLGTALDLEAQLKTSAERVLLSVFVPVLLLTAWLWRGRVRWTAQRWARWLPALAGAVVVAAMYRTGWVRLSDEELAGVTLSPYPVAFSWLWVIVGAVTIVWVLRRRRRRRTRAIAWRALQFAVATATMGLAVLVAGFTAREVGELHRRFGRRPLAEQHRLVTHPALQPQIDAALAAYPPGTPVRVLPKRSFWYHRFHYEVFPRLIVDASATASVDLQIPP